MDELKNFYNQWQKRMFVICYFIWFVLLIVFFLLNQSISELLDICMNSPECIQITKDNRVVWDYFVSFFTDFVGPLSVTYGIYIKTMDYINTTGWKKKFPHLDIDGTWNDITTYTKKFDDKGITSENDDKKVPSPVIIEQTCNSFKIKQSVGDDFEWCSLMADWKDNKLMILYRVEYKSKLQKDGFPEQRTGFECMSIKNIGRKGRPVEMVGNFHHCVYDDKKPVYMGDVVYKRVE